MLNFRGGERVDCYVEIFFDEAQHFLVPLKRQVGMQSALNHELRAARVDSLLHLAQNFFVRQKIRAALIRTTEERAEFAFVLADVRVIYISVDDESHNVAEFFFADFIGAFAEFEQVAFRKNF